MEYVVLEACFKIIFETVLIQHNYQGVLVK